MSRRAASSMPMISSDAHGLRPLGERRTVLCDPVQRVAGRRAVALVQRADERTCAAARLGPVTDPPGLPPVRRAREEPGRPLPDPLVQPWQRRAASRRGRSGGSSPREAARAGCERGRASPRRAGPSRRGRSRSGRRSSPRTPRAPPRARRASRTSRSCASIIRRSSPCRRCDGRTPTTVTPAQATGPPGSVSSCGYAPAPATIRPSSTTASIRSRGRIFENRSASSGVGCQPK